MKDNNYLLSIVIPAFNRPNTLNRLLMSVAAAALDFRQQIEIIVTDDSTEPEPIKEVCQNYSEFNTLNIKYIQNESEVHSPGSNRRNGLNNSYGTWVMFVDDDDTFNTFDFNLLRNELLNADDEVIMFRTDWLTLEEDGTISPSWADFFTKQILTHGKIYKKSILDLYNINYSPTNKYNEDVYLNFQVYPLIYSGRYKEKELPIRYYLFYNNNSSISRRLEDGKNMWDRCVRDDLEEWIESYLLANVRILKLLTREELKNYCNNFFSSVLVNMMMNLMFIEKIDGYEKNKEIYNVFYNTWKEIFAGLDNDILYTILRYKDLLIYE